MSRQLEVGNDVIITKTTQSQWCRSVVSFALVMTYYRNTQTVFDFVINIHIINDIAHIYEFGFRVKLVKSNLTPT